MELGATRLARTWATAAGGSIAFRLSPYVEIGGAARVTLTTPTPMRDGRALRLRYGYGGLQLGAFPAPTRWPELRVGLLLGGGNADAVDPGLGTLLDSDNGPVLEPSLGWGRALGPGLAATGTLSWRFATRMELLGRLRSSDFRGPSAALGLTIGPF